MNFIDHHCRYHQNPVTDSNPYPGNNAFLYTGYASVLGMVPQHRIKNIMYAWVLSQTAYGYDRHPNYDHTPASSHDEVVGIFMLNPLDHGSRLRLKTLKENHYQVCNLDGFKPKAWWKLNPLRVIRDLWRLSREENPRKATYKYPYIWPITFSHAPEHVYFYHRMAGVKPGIYLELRFILASYFSINFGNPSGQTMLGFKLLALKKIGLTDDEEELYQYFFDRVDFIEVVRKYFAPYENHPINTALQYTDLSLP